MHFLKRAHLNKRNKEPAKLQSKLFLFILLPSFIVLTCFTVLFSTYNSQILIRQEQNTLQTLSDSLKNQIEDELRGLDAVSSNINFYNRKHPFLTSQMDTDVNSTHGKLVVDYLQIINGLDSRADQINLYGLTGNAIEMGKITKNQSYTADDVPWMEDVLSLHGKRMISKPHETMSYSPGTVISTWYISLYRALLDDRNQVIGASEVMESCTHLFRSIQQYQRITANAAQICIFDSSGNLIFPYSTDESQNSVYQSYYSMLPNLQEGSGSLTDPQSGEKKRYVLSSSYDSGWTYLTMQSDSVILQPVYKMLRLLIGAILILLFLSILLSYLFSRNLVRPVKHLKHVIQQMELSTLGKENVTEYTVPYQELGELFQQFQKMSVSLQKSLKELETARALELHSRVLALQSQMNPHFYYNTLACISILAENGETEEVVTMCQKLSSIMRYITNAEEAEVTLEREFCYIEEYMYCMKIRYQDSLQFHISLQDSMRNIHIPKLIIQPLVENAIKYGTGTLPPWTISVTSYSDNTQWYVTVTDSGKGFDPATMQDLKGKLAEVDHHPNDQTSLLKIGGMGLVNVYIRWKIACQDSKIVFDFGNTEEGHAFVRIGKQTEEAQKNPENVNKE